MSDLQVRQVPLDDLAVDAANPRQHDDQNIDAIMRSLQEHGQVEPLVVQQSTMMVIGGNGRLEAMRALGWTHAGCVVLDVDDVQARRLSISLNRTSELAGWDTGVLARHLEELAAGGDGFDPNDLGFSEDEYDKLVAELDSLAAEDPAPEEPGQEQPGGSTDEKPATDPSLPPGTEPGHLPSSDVRMIQLFFDPEREKRVRVWCKRLAEELKTASVTDTVYAVLETAAEERGWKDE